MNYLPPFGLILDAYADRRKELGRMYPGDAQGFYCADAYLRIELGLELTMDNIQALEAERRPVLQQGENTPF